MLNSIRAYSEREPLTFIMSVGLLFRLISVIFSTGYGMHDDHFLVIEAAQSWVDGFDYNNWLPQNSINGEPTGHSFFYVGLHYIFFKFCGFIGIYDPQFKMFLIRLIHGLWSMLTVYFGYRITQKLSNSENARIVGLLLALFWFFPILSVRNMVEMVCMPFLMMSFYYLIKDEINWKNALIAGLLMGLAVAVRIQTDLIFGGIGLVLLFQRKIVQAIVFGLATVLALFITQLTDLVLWGYPFAEILQYVLYNSSHYEDYITQAWFQYLLVIGGLLIPPVSIFLFYGTLRTWRKHLLIFLPVMIFLVFHSMYPNKQERFILPIMPFVILLGVIGWREFYLKSTYWKNHPKLYNGFLRFFWILNIAALLVISPASTKKSRVDTMYYLSSLTDVNGLLLERTTNYGCYLMPRFYHGKWDIPHLCYSKNESAKYAESDFNELARSSNINYCLFIEEEDLDERLGEMKAFFPDMIKVEVIEPSYVDKLLHFLNPRNQNETVHIYKLY